MIENSFLKYFLSNCDNELLHTFLDIIKPRKSTGSLAALDNFSSDKYQNFMRFSLVKDDSAFGTEPFPGLLMKLCQEATLLKNILDLLTEFYNCLYNNHFTSILSITGLNKDVVVNSKIKLFGRLRIGADILYMVLLKQLVIKNHHIYRSEEHTSELQSLRHLVCRL